MTAPEPLLASVLEGQERTRSFLTDALARDHIGHAYLFLGVPGSGKRDAALGFAQGILCPSGGCGTCDSCQRVVRESHPDLHVYRPLSSRGYLIDQIRGITEELLMTPVMGSRRVFVIEEAERLTEASANAFLKSLEEPPEGVTFILLGSARDAVLPTILSRCQVVPFLRESKETLVRRLSDQTGAFPALCRRALACCRIPREARAFLEDPGRQQARLVALRSLDRLLKSSPYGALQLAKEVVDSANATYADFKKAQEDHLAEIRDNLGKSVVKDIEEQQRRDLSARACSVMIECLEAQRSLLGDALACSVDPAHVADNDDFAPTALLYANRLGTDGLAKACSLVDGAMANIRRGATPLLAFEALFLEIKEMLSCQP